MLWSTRRKLLVAAPFVIIPSIADAQRFAPFQATSTGDPWTNLDGRLNAPSGTPQFPTILNTYHPSGPADGRYLWPSNAAFNNSTGNYQQPQWHVPGVDYAVGPDSAYGSSIAWKVPGTDALPSGATLTNANLITISGTNVTLDGWDLTQNSGQAINITGSGATVSNCKALAGNATEQMLQSSAAGSLVKNCSFNANGFDPSSTAILNYTYTGATSFATGITLQYCLFEYSGSDGWYPNSGGSPTFWFTAQHSVVLDMGCSAGSHPDWMQLGGSGTHNWNLSFNMCVQNNTVVGSQPWVLVTQNGTGTQQGNVNNNVWLARNVASAGFPGSNNLNNMFYLGATEASRGTGMFVTQNYLDNTASSGLWGGGTTGGGTFSGNVLLTTGATTP